MILEELIITNYRSCQYLEVNLLSETPNVFIGINDCGKSTILQSIDLLLGDKPLYNSIGEGQNKSDLSNSPLISDEFKKLLHTKQLPEIDYNENQTVVIGKLVFTEEEVLAYDEMNLSNTLKWTLECTIDNKLWIVKTFSSTSNQFMILTKDFSSQ